MDKTESKMNEEIAQIKARLPNYVSGEDRTKIQAANIAMRKLVESMGIQASWHKDDILKLESKLGVIVMRTTPSILIIDNKLSNKSDIATQILRLKKFIEMNEDETQSKKIFLKNHHFSANCIQLMNKIVENETEAGESLLGKLSNVEDNSSKLKIAHVPQYHEDNTQIIVGHLNPPNRIFNETFQEYSSRVKLFLVANRIPKTLWTNFIYSSLNWFLNK
ncbi:hypothetical protein SNEBB_006510, partial [Seison nebaliae]